jgi:hypothetical protein
MSIITDNITPGGWVRLEVDGATVGLDRWPGPLGPGHPIVSTGGCFEFDHLDYDVDGAPEHVYRWRPS